MPRTGKLATSKFPKALYDQLQKQNQQCKCGKPLNRWNHFLVRGRKTLICGSCALKV